MVKVSVIIPVFNAEKYLSECLDSIRRQTLKDIEVICVDDGSTDGSAEIVRAFVRRDSRFRLLQQTNAGAGVARNTGLDVATGEYLSFCDPDDWCDATMLETLCGIADRELADVVMFGLSRFDSVTRKELSVMRIVTPALMERLSQRKSITAAEIADQLLTVGGNGPCNKLFRRAVAEAHGLRFQPLRRTNDLFFVKAFLSHAERLAFLERPFYHYRRGISSATTNDALAGSFCLACEAVYDHLTSTGRMGPYRDSFGRMLVGSFMFNFRSISSEAALEKWFADIGPRVKRLLADGSFAENSLLGKVEREVCRALRDGAPLADLKRILLAGKSTPVAKPSPSLSDRDAKVIRQRLAAADARIEQLRKRAAKESRALRTEEYRLYALNREVLELKLSAAYRVGMLVSWPFRKVYRFFRPIRARKG